MGVKCHFCCLNSLKLFWQQKKYFFPIFHTIMINRKETKFCRLTLRYKQLNILYYLVLKNNRKLALQNFHIQMLKTTMNLEIYSILSVIKHSLTILEHIEAIFREISFLQRFCNSWTIVHRRECQVLFRIFFCCWRILKWVGLW